MQLISVKFQGRNRQSNNNRKRVGEGGSDAQSDPCFFQKFTTGMVDWHFIGSCWPLLWYSEGSFSSTEPRTNWMHNTMNSWLRNASALNVYPFFSARSAFSSMFSGRGMRLHTLLDLILCSDCWAICLYGISVDTDNTECTVVVTMANWRWWCIMSGAQLIWQLAVVRFGDRLVQPTGLLLVYLLVQVQEKVTETEKRSEEKHIFYRCWFKHKN